MCAVRKKFILKYFILLHLLSFGSIGPRMPLDTKVRIKLGKMTMLSVFLLLTTLGFSSGSAPKCDKRPLGQQSHKTYGDNGFKVTPYYIVFD